MSFANDISNFTRKVEAGRLRSLNLQLQSWRNRSRLKHPLVILQAGSRGQMVKFTILKDTWAGLQGLIGNMGMGIFHSHFARANKSGNRTISRIINELNSLEPFQHTILLTIHHIS